MSSVDYIAEVYRNKIAKYYELAEKRAREEILAEYGKMLNQILDGTICPYVLLKNQATTVIDVVGNFENKTTQ